MALVAEGRLDELAARIEGLDERERPAEDGLAGAARGGDDAPDVADAKLDRMVRVEDGLPRRVAEGMSEALPARPCDGLLRRAVVLEDLRAVAEPEEQRHRVAVLQQLPVGSEELREEGVEEGLVLAEERLRPELQRAAAEEGIGGEGNRGEGSHFAKARSAKSSAHAQS